MIGLTAALFWLLTDPSFRITEASLSFDGLEHADEAAVRSHLSGIDRGPNVFRVRAADIVSDVSTLPDVDAASASVTLPAQISVRLEERVPLFVWRGAGAEWLVDEEGMLFGPTVQPVATDGIDATGIADASPAPVVVDEDVRSGLPTVVDARLPEQLPTVGSHLPAADLAVMRQLLALTPELLGSRADELKLSVDQEKGYWLQSDQGWQAIFGHYSPRVQPPDDIARQVQCLEAVLARGEQKLQQVWLSVADEACGTFKERGT
jgi:hypothetical protein